MKTLLSADCVAIACRAMDGFQAKRIIDNWTGFYSSARPHTALDNRTPNTAYFDQRKYEKQHDHNPDAS